MSLGSLRVTLGLDAAEFTRGLTKAEQEADKFRRGMVNLGTTIGTALGTALGVSLTVGAGAAILFEKLIGKAAGFQDLAEKTGASAEALASFNVAASITNTSMETLANLSVKLTKGLAGTDEETKQAANAIKQLGLNVNEFKKLDPATQFEVLAKQLNKFEDGAGKTAFAVAAMGKAGAEGLPFLKELGNQTQRNIILTAAQIKAADDYKDSQARLRAEIELYATSLATNVLPVVQDFQKALFETAKQILGVSEAGAKLAGTNDVQEFADKGARSLAVLVDAIDLVIRGFQLGGNAIASIAAQATALFERNLAGIRQIRAESEAEARKIIDRPLFSSNLQAQQERSAREREIAADPDNRRLANRVAAFTQKDTLDPRKFGGGGKSGGADKAAQEAKKLLDKQLSDLENFSKAEQRLLESRNNSLDRLYDQDRLSIADYFKGKAEALDRATFEQADIYNEQIALLEKFYNDTREQTAKLDALKEIGKFKEKRSDLLADRSNQATKDFDARARAAREYAGQVAEVQARVLELQGTEEAAARAALIRFDIQNRALLNRARIEGDSGTEAAVGQLRAREEAQTRINALLRDASVIEQNLATSQAKLHLERDLGMRGEIDSLKLLASSSTDAAAKLQVIADKYLAIAKADGSAVLIANAEAFKQKVTELAAATDILAAQFRKTFVDTGASAIETFLNNLAEGKNALDSFKEAFKQFATDITRQINRIAAQSIADALFKPSGGGGSGGILSGLADAFVQYIGGFAGKEQGGPVSGRTAYVVGERGPELFVPQKVAAQATKQIDSLIAQRGKPAEYKGERVAAIAANLPHMIGAKGPEIFVPKTSGIVIPNDKVTKLATVLEKKARPPIATVLEKTVNRQSNLVLDKSNSSSRRETILRDEKIIKRYANAPSQREKYLQQSARAIARNQRAVADLVTDAPRQRRATGGRVTAATPYLVGELGPELFVPKQAEQVIKNEKAIDALISNTTQRKNVTQLNNTNEVQRKSINLFTDTNATQRKNVENTNENNLTKTINKAVSINKAIIANTSNKATNNNAITNIKKAIHNNTEISSKAIKAISTSAVSNQEIRNQAIRNKSINSAISNQAISNKAIDNSAISNINKAVHEAVIKKSINNESTNSAVTNNAIHNKSVTNKGTIDRLISNIERTTKNVERTTNQSKLLVSNAGSIGPALNNIINVRGGTSALSQITNIQGGALLSMPSEKIINNNRKISELITRHQTDKTVINNLKNIENATSELLKPLADVAITVPAETIINNNSKISELLIRQRNEKVINNLKNVEKKTAELWKPIVGSAATVPTEKINSKISQLISDQRTAKTVINNLKSVEKTTELLRPATSKIVSNELSEFVSNIQNNQTVNEAVQARANGGPVAAYQAHLVGERGAEIFVPRDISVPSDFFTNNTYRRAWGGMVNANRPYIVGERGPEMFVPKTAGQIVTNNKIRGTSTIVINQQFAPGTTRDTINQAAAKAGQSVQRAQMRGLAS